MKNISTGTGIALLAAALFASVPAIADGCRGDTNGNGRVDGVDLAQVLADWGPCDGCAGDVDLDGLVGGPDLGLVLNDWGLCAPQVTSVTPALGTFVGGTAITLHGRYFRSAAIVKVGGVSAVNTVVVSSTVVTAITPSGSPGTSDVSIETAAGISVLASGFRYTATPPWAAVVEQQPDANIVTNVALRQAITGTGLPWRVRDTITGIELLLIPPGTFDMGASPNDFEADTNENPRHTVTLTKPYYLSKFEIRQDQWQSMMGNNPSYFGGQPDHPVESVGWQSAVAFCSAAGFRLPSEAEWDYACRAGTTSSRYGSVCYCNESVAWWGGTQGNSPWGHSSVGARPPNGFGLHDMLGNVWEWCADWNGPYDAADAVDPVGSISQSRLRGGSWLFGSGMCRASQRNPFSPGGGFYDSCCGFRVAKNPW